MSAIPFTPEAFFKSVHPELLKKLFQYLLPDEMGDLSANIWPDSFWIVGEEDGKFDSQSVAAKLKGLEPGLQCVCYQEFRDIFYVAQGSYRNMNIVTAVSREHPDWLMDRLPAGARPSRENVAVIAYLAYNESSKAGKGPLWKNLKWDALRSQSWLSPPSRFVIPGESPLPSEGDVAKVRSSVERGIGDYLKAHYMCGDFVSLEWIPTRTDVMRLLVHYSGTLGMRLTWTNEKGIESGEDNSVGVMNISFSRKSREMIIQSELKTQAPAAHRAIADIVSRAIFKTGAERKGKVAIRLQGFSDAAGAGEILARPISAGTVERVAGMALQLGGKWGEKIDYSCGGGSAYAGLEDRLKEGDAFLCGPVMVLKVSLEVRLRDFPKVRFLNLTPTSYGRTRNEELNDAVEQILDELKLLGTDPEPDENLLFDFGAV